MTPVGALLIIFVYAAIFIAAKYVWDDMDKN